MDGDASFGHWLRLRRKALHLSCAELARLVGCATITLRKIEADERRPSQQVAERLADCLQIAAQARALFVQVARAQRPVFLLADPSQILPPASPGPLPDPPPSTAPLSTLQLGAHNLPSPPTALIGREQEVAALCALVRRQSLRLLTLSGPAGVGKTRLALQVAAELVGDFAGNVWFVALAPLRDPSLVATTIAQALGVREVGDRPLLASLKVHLQDQRALLLVDNFEHLLSDSALVGELLAACPRLKVLVTSRSVLRVYGEQEFVIPPLNLPERRRRLSPEELAEAAALRLFALRAQAVQSNFTIRPENIQAVVEICQRLDGLPLALELAAARIKLFPPQALLSRLSNRLTLLTGGARDVPVRQQTLRNAIDWSYDLLDAGEQLLFRRLGVFVGGCTLKAAEAVCNADGDLPLDLLDSIAALIDHSLLRQEVGADGEPRFGMLETIREYALDRLIAGGETLALYQQYAIYYLALAEAAEPELTGPRQLIWLETLEQEHDNVRAALQWALEHGEVELAARLGGASWRFWYTHGHLSEGRQWLAKILANSNSVATPVRAKALLGAGLLASIQNDYARSVDLYEESLAFYRGLGDKKGSATTLVGLGWVAMEQGDYARATVLFEESLALFQELKEKHGMANALNNLGSVALEQGDYERAVVLRQEAGALYREIGDQHGIAISLNNLGDMARIQGDHSRAVALLAESLVLFRQVGDQYGTANTLSNLGSAMYNQGDYRQATRYYEECLTLFSALGDGRGIAESLEGMAGAIGAQGQPAAAARLFGAAEGLRATIGVPLTPVNGALYDHMVAFVRTQLDEVACAAAWAAGRAMATEQAIAYALTQGGSWPS
jgi:predicted ATPase/transcriptional regulator with XRE-family HTH domain